MASELQAQKFVHELEHGRGKWWVWFLVVMVVAAYQVMTFLFWNPLNGQGWQSTFHGMTHAKGMEQAVIARELSRGHGFSTTIIKPAAVNMAEEKLKSEEAFMNYMKPNGPTGGNIPDFYHAPLSPFLNSLAFRAAVKINDAAKIRTNEEGKADFWGFQKFETLHPADKVVAGVAVLCFLCAVVVNFLLAKLLFDERLGVLLVLILLLCDHLWKFAETGLPQMLMLLLFSLALYFFARARVAQEANRLVWPWYLGVGLSMGLLALTHALTLWMLLPLIPIVIVAIVIRRWAYIVYSGIVVACVAVCFVPWMVRTAKVSGTAGGLGWETRKYQLAGSESQIMRTYKSPDKGPNPTEFRSKIQGQYLAQLKELNEHLGVGTIAPFFFLTILHAFRRPETRSMRWVVLGTWVGALFGMCVFGFPDFDLQATYQANDLHLLFIPMMVAYGLSLILNMWGRVVVQNRELANLPLFNISFLTGLVLLNSLPLLNTYTDPPKAGIVFPPYHPFEISKLSDWYTERDIVCSDMPWATAWYADRKSLWLPLTIPDFSEFNSVFHFNGRITGLMFTPVTGYRGLLNEVGVGEFREWKPFITREPRVTNTFVLKVMHQMWFPYYVLYSDRNRFEERPN